MLNTPLRLIPAALCSALAHRLSRLAYRLHRYDVKRRNGEPIHRAWRLSRVW
jgi:hypothetical protein